MCFDHDRKRTTQIAVNRGNLQTGSEFQTLEVSRLGNYFTWPR
ncbi:hypothetical protein [Planktothrix agardhii]